MGIKHLWLILTPFGERKPLYELQGKTVAIDLSCWICEAQNVTEYYIQPKMYLRNLYFRTSYLLLMDVNPVFVLEGKAPELKFDTIAARNEIQFKGAKPKTNVKTSKDRSRFHFVLQRCEEMLRLMGLVCVKGKGEAEALCAYLNENKLVDGCISQDSDCFAYGAKVVYRNFSVSQQGVHAGSGGAVDVYDIQKAKDALNFGRNKIIALALLCGSDYSDGVYGIGKEAAMKLFENVSDEEILDRLRSWKTNDKLYEGFYKQLNDKNICNSCGHFGKLQSHTKTGCNECKMAKGCDFSKFKDKRLEIKNEVAMRGKAMADPTFPNEEIVKEFLVRKDNISKLDLKWKQPNLIHFVKFTLKHLQWEQIYAFEKFLPIFTRWQLLNFEHFPVNGKIKGILMPERIKKVRNPKGIPSYEIIWKDPEGHYKDLIPSNQLLDVDLEKLWSTIEPQEVFRKAYPEQVHAFEQSKIKPKKPSKRKQPKNPIDNIEKMLQNTSISEPQPKTKRKNIQKPPKSKPIDSYFKKAVLNNFQAKNPVEEIKITHNDSFNLDLSGFGDENDLDISDIVQDIVNRSPPSYIQENLNMLGHVTGSDVKESSFFMTDVVENDEFEKSMHCEKLSDSSEEDEEEENLKANERSEDSDESFMVEYVPLLTRLKGTL